MLQGQTMSNEKSQTAQTAQRTDREVMAPESWEQDRCVDIEFKPVDFCISNPGDTAQGTGRNQAYSTTADHSLIIARYVDQFLARSNSSPCFSLFENVSIYATSRLPSLRSFCLFC